MKEDYTCQAPDLEKELGHFYLPSPTKTILRVVIIYKTFYDYNFKISAYLKFDRRPGKDDAEA